MEALPLAEAIQRFAARIRRLTLFDNLKKSADSGPSKQLVTNSAQYGLTKGTYTAEYLELTPEGRTASGDESVGKPRVAARLQLAIARVGPFNSLYEQFKGKRLPAIAVLRDFAIEQGTSRDNADECVQTFMANGRDLELIRTYAGAERLLTFEMVLDEVEPGNQVVDGGVSDIDEPLQTRPPLHIVSPLGEASAPARVLAEAYDLSEVCFLVTPIGAEGSEQRRHANLVLGALLEPALEGLGL